jgi:hypothetical protein
LTGGPVTLGTKAAFRGLAFAPSATITSASTGTAQAGYPYSYTITSLGVTSPSYAASPLPSGLSVNSSTGVIS